MSRRHELVSAEDEALFRHAVRDAKPLVRRVTVTSSAGLHRKVFVPLASHRPADFVATRPAAPEIRGHAEARLRRGRLDPEARIDLHGHSYETAYRSLVAFLTRAYAEDKRLVLVITGKGGVLRPHLALWLNAPELQDLVIGMREAHAKHGGGGAFYVAIQKRKAPGYRP
jgi:DNA-nicking Smr family endonuclease